MENKLQELTQKLYEDGLSKGKAEAATIIENAKKEAENILNQANAQADFIIKNASQEAESLKSTIENELKLASSQLVSAIKQQVENLIRLKVVDEKISECWKDGSFIKTLILDSLKCFNPTASDSYQIIFPENFSEEIRKAISSNLQEGVECVTDGKIKVPFRIAPKDGSYYISFTDEDFQQLFRGYLRQRISEILYK